MISDKDKEDAESIYHTSMQVYAGSIEDSALCEMVSRIRAESVEQARKEAVDRAVAFVRDQGMEQMEMWGEYDDNRLRAAILGDSVIKESLITDHIPDSGKKLAIAVKALEEIQAFDTGTWDKPIPFSELWRQARNISDNALKEMQG